MTGKPRAATARAALLLGGLALGLGLAEAGLRLYGALRMPEVRAPGDQGGLRILCMGDSFAYGLGSEDQRGPCEHLEALLEERAGPDAVAAFNRAVPGFNSSQAADALGDALAEAQPQLLVVTVGHNNGWNFAGLHLDEGEGGAGLRISRGLGGLRLVKLAQLLLRYDRTPQVDPPTAQDPAVTAWYDRQNRASKIVKLEGERERLQTFLAQHPDDVFSLVQLSDLSKGAGDPAEAQRLLDRAQALDPQAVARARAGLRQVDGWHERNRSHGQESHLVGGEASRADLYRALGEQRSLEDQRQLLDRVLQRDLEAMATQARAMGAEVIFSGYPGDKPANLPLRAAAEALGLHFVDQQASFEAALARDGDPGHWFVLDGHCTSAGYRRVAENLLPFAEALLPEHPQPE